MASEGQAKVSLILELKNRMKTAFSEAKENVSKNVNAMKDKISELRMHHTKAFTAMKDQIPGLSSGLELLANPYVAIAAAVVGLGIAYGKSVKMALDWQKGMAEVNVTAQLTQQELGNLSHKLLDIGANNVAPLEEIPGTFNKIISAGLDVNQSLKALEPTLRAAKAGFTDTTTVATAGINVMKSSGEDINKVYDVLFATLNKGNAKFADIAQYLPKIVPDAKNLGFTLAEVGGAFAYMTAQGQTAESSTTLLQNVFKAFSRTPIRDELKKIGVSVYDSQGKIRPFVSIIEDLKTSLNGLTDEQRIKKLEKLGLDGEASRGLSTMVQNAGELKTTIDATTNSAGALNKAYKDSLTPLDSWLEISNKIKKEMILIGEKALPYITKIGEKVLSLIDYFKELYQNSEFFRDSISLIGKYVGWAFDNAMIPIRQAYNMIKLVGTLFSWISEKIFGTGDGFEQFYSKIKPYLLWIYDMMSQLSNITYKVMTFDFEGAYEAAKNFKMPDLADIKQRIILEKPQPTLGIYAPPGYGKKNEKENALAEGLPTDDKKTDQPTGKETIDKITSGATTSKNITINIDSFNKGGINTAHTNLQNMDATQIEQWMTDMFMRVIRNVERSY